jgi:hypothetical protein
MFVLQEGAILSNAIIGPNNGEGVHCLGTCTLNNIWWVDVCEDAATFKQKSGTSYVNGGGKCRPQASWFLVKSDIFALLQVPRAPRTRYSNTMVPVPLPSRTSTPRASASCTVAAATAERSMRARAPSMVSRSRLESLLLASTVILEVGIRTDTAWWVMLTRDRHHLHQ